MKLLHKQLLVTCTPYLLLIAGVLVLQACVIEPAEARRLHQETMRELNRHAAHIRQIMELAVSQLKMTAELPAFSSGDMETVKAELQRIDSEQAGCFTAIYFHNLTIGTVAGNGPSVRIITPPDELELEAGKVIVSSFRVASGNKKPAFLIMVPVSNPLGKPIYAMIGELEAGQILTVLNRQSNDQTEDFSIDDAVGNRLNRHTIAATTSGGMYLNRNQFLTEESLLQNGIRGYHTSIPPWNWRLNKHVPEETHFGANRFLCRLIVLFSLFSMILTAAGVIWRHWSAAACLASLTETLQRFGAGEQNLRSQEVSSDELGRLAEAFNCMADDVVHAQKKLQKQLAEHEQSPTLWKQQHADLQTKIAELERFAASAAHELKAPLVTMQGFAKGLEATAKAGDWGRFHDDVHRIQQSGKNLQATVDVLLLLARAGQGAALTDDVSLQTAANEAVELLQGVIDPQHIDISISPDLPTIKGDPVLWRHVFQNLIDNALQACDGVTSPKIEIGCELRDGQMVCFVRDNGKGLNSQDCERFFERSSTGLGLTLIKQVIEHHGGKVWVESEGTGKGTTLGWKLRC